MHDPLVLTIACIALGIHAIELGVAIVILLALSREAPKEPAAC